MPKIVFLLLSMLLFLVGCTDETISKLEPDAQKEITILIQEPINPIIESYKFKFENSKGVKVKFDIIDADTLDDYIKKLNINLYLKNGPTLIYLPQYFFYQSYIDSGVALEVTDRITNLEKIYDSLKEEKVYYVPIGMYYVAKILNKSTLDELDVKEPSLDWTKDDYLKIKEKWLSKKPRYFTFKDYDEIIKEPLYNLKIIEENNKISINNLKIKEFIKNTREKIFSGKYILKDYSYENYYKIFVEGINTSEYRRVLRFLRLVDKEILVRNLGINAFETKRVSEMIDKGDAIILPEVINENNSFFTWGFIVNRNGKNTNLGIEFINGLLSDEVQLSMYGNGKLFGGFYPVNKEIESKIDKIDEIYNYNKKAVELKKFILEKIKKSKIRPYNYDDRIHQELYDMLHRDLFKFIFVDKPYKDEELSRELQKLEDKLNMWLNE
ncbi:ABC-type glycerol-3-phosphate transport system, substrate-binding protein [Caloranaerobacter azorensis DSM 13643]|uniref:ABC-type glycerol-3-phosphate transport system, substrate-binding protein n=1 Tax=Caloranaerobacter azorensis DSM 13643 TaxID=1121264 RepID=A0A1M5S7D3_9FIRM|nr:extracellular solute-binding protein [Caloranaerobacter azorensis]SHH34389.1 ABC-type glycerol-3-phosphate transport system, substrate-binding protein [Caloranaerobacter azorensis DSM 13643]